MILDDAKFAQVYQQHFRHIRGLCMKIVHDWSDAEDCAQNTFLKAYSKRQQFEGRSLIYTWLHRIAVNESLMCLRRRRETCEYDEEFSDAFIDEFIAHVERVTFSEIIARLSPVNRTAVEMRMAGMDVKDIAKAVGVSNGTMKSRLHHAREKCAQWAS